MDKKAKFRATGYVLAIAGLLVAATSLVPHFFSKEDFPWPLLLGSFVYLHGAFLVLIGSRTSDGKAHMGRLRYVRLGFVLVFALIVWRLVAA